MARSLKNLFYLIILQLTIIRCQETTDRLECDHCCMPRYEPPDDPALLWTLVGAIYVIGFIFSCY